MMSTSGARNDGRVIRICDSSQTNLARESNVQPKRRVELSEKEIDKNSARKKSRSQSAEDHIYDVRVTKLLSSPSAKRFAKMEDALAEKTQRCTELLTKLENIKQKSAQVLRIAKDAIEKCLTLSQENLTLSAKCLRVESNYVDMCNKYESLYNEYVLKQPRFDVVYEQNIEMMMAGDVDVNEVMKDGRVCAFLMLEFMKKRWNVGDNLQVKMFTRNGTIISPSKNIGCKRELNPLDTKQFVEEHGVWVFVNNQTFPCIRYVFKSSSDVLHLFSNTTNGKLSGSENDFARIVTAKVEPSDD